MIDQEDIHAHLHMDNRTSVFYVNCMGGTHSSTMNILAIHWQWCLKRNFITDKKSVSRVEAAPEDISTDSGKVSEVYSGSVDLFVS